jgi:hypothetical protein
MTCVFCERPSDQVPLIPFEYKGQDYRICTAHLPMLLHKPELFEGKLADAGKNWSSGEENHHHD